MAGAGSAHAAGPDVETSEQVGAVSGNQVIAPIQAPINICGIAAAVLGTATAGCEGGAEATFDGPGGELWTHGNTGLGNGNQAYAPVQVPTEVSGIAAAVGGASDAWSTGGSNASVAESGRHAESGDVTTQSNYGALSGNQLLAPIQAPINACGNAVAVGGVGDAGCEGGAEADYDGPGGDLTTQDNVGLGNGNQLYAPIQAPINVCGNAVAVLGYASASCEGGSDADIDEPEHHSHKKAGYTESSTTEAADVNVNEEQLPAGGVPGLDTVTDTTGDLAGGLPVVGGLTGGLGDNVTPEDVVSTATDTVAGATELAGAGLL
ncbi:chaplin family protein [Glycomyces tarimensis]